MTSSLKNVTLVPFSAKFACFVFISWIVNHVNWKNSDVERRKTFRFNFCLILRLLQIPSILHGRNSLYKVNSFDALAKPFHILYVRVKLKLRSEKPPITSCYQNIIVQVVLSLKTIEEFKNTSFNVNSTTMKKILSQIWDEGKITQENAVLRNFACTAYWKWNNLIQLSKSE